MCNLLPRSTNYTSHTFWCIHLNWLNKKCLVKGGCKRPNQTRSRRAILFDVLDAEAITEDAAGPPAINTNQGIKMKMSILSKIFSV